MSSESLNLATLIVALMSMTLSCMALWPQCRDGVALIRDAILWAALIAVVVGATTLGWRSFQTRGDATLSSDLAAEIDSEGSPPAGEVPGESPGATSTWQNPTSKVSAWQNTSWQRPGWQASSAPVNSGWPLTPGNRHQIAPGQPFAPGQGPTSIQAWSP